MSRSLGILPDRYLGILDVPGTVLFYQESTNDPDSESAENSHRPELIKTKDGIVLSPQPHEDPNDPLNWPVWRRDLMLIVLGVHCLIGGGQTPILAAGFHTLAAQFGVSLSKIALTTGVYMLFLGIGSVILSPTALLFGKRPVYLLGQSIFLIGSIWCAAAPSWSMLLIGRMITGIGVSPCESLPSSSIAEIFFLHERAFRLGIYTMLLIGGKNLVPLVSAAVIQSLGWRWVFIIVAIIVAVMFVLTYLCVPETSWDRTPLTPDRLNCQKSRSNIPRNEADMKESSLSVTDEKISENKTEGAITSPTSPRIRFAPHVERSTMDTEIASDPEKVRGSKSESIAASSMPHVGIPGLSHPLPVALDLATASPRISRFGSPHSIPRTRSSQSLRRLERQEYAFQVPPQDIELIVSGASQHSVASTSHEDPTLSEHKEIGYQFRKKTYREMLAIYQGRISREKWWKAALRPFILYAYPAVAFATLLYSLSVVWLIVLSEVVAQIFEVAPYNLSRLSVGLLYISPFVGGVLGSALSGKVSDLICRFMTRRNGGVFEPEFRLVMVIPIVISTVMGLWGFGWSAQVQDPWITPAVFFGVIGFGCTLGSTVSISFVVDSYRADAGSSLTSLNLSKNVMGFIFSLITNNAVNTLGVRGTFLILGGIHLGICALAIPLYVFGKRARGWTHRMAMMDWLYDG